MSHLGKSVQKDCWPGGFLLLFLLFGWGGGGGAAGRRQPRVLVLFRILLLLRLIRLLPTPAFLTCKQVESAPLPASVVVDTVRIPIRIESIFNMVPGSVSGNGLNPDSMGSLDQYPETDWIRIQWGPWIRIRDPDSQFRIRIQEGKNDHKNRRKS